MRMLIGAKELGLETFEPLKSIAVSFLSTASFRNQPDFYMKRHVLGDGLSLPQSSFALNGGLKRPSHLTCTSPQARAGRSSSRHRLGTAANCYGLSRAAWPAM